METLSWSRQETPSSNVCCVDLLPDELWLNIFKLIHPVYNDLLSLSFVCKKWRGLLILHPDPCLWEQIRLSSVRYCTPDSPLLNRFRKILYRFGRYIKTLSIHRCHECFSNSLRQFVPTLASLQSLEITGMKWDKGILRKLVCFKSLKNIVLGASEVVNEFFTEKDLCYISDNFPKLRTFGLLFSSLKSEDITILIKLSSSPCSGKVTYLGLERGRLGEMVLNYIIQGFSHLENFCYGNDNIYGWPSVQSLALESKSVTEVNIFNVGDVAEFVFYFPFLKKLRLTNSTSVQNLHVNSPSLRSLVLTNCVELRKLKRIYTFSLEKLEMKGCTALGQAELLNFLVKNPGIKSMALGVHWPHLRLDQYSNPSLESLFISDNGGFLSTVDICCPKLKRFCVKKSFLRPTKLKAVRILGEECVLISLSDMPYLRRLNVDARKITTFEVDFDRTADQIKPAAFTKIKFLSEEIQIKQLALRRCNIGSVFLTSCNVQHVTFDSCNLDCTLCDILGKCGAVETVTFIKCYGPCQLMLEHPSVKEVYISSCSTLMMERITLICPSLELLTVKQCTFLPAADELEFIGNNLKVFCPNLQSVKFSCH